MTSATQEQPPAPARRVAVAAYDERVAVRVDRVAVIRLRRGPAEIEHVAGLG